MWVTMYTDASYYDNRKEAGWAYWLKSDKGRIINKGVEKAECSNVAELIAALKGIEECIRSWPDTKGISINSDNMSVVQGIYPDGPFYKNENIRLLQLKIQKLAKDSNIQLKSKYVRAHTGRNDSRSYINRRVDTLSKQVVKDHIRDNPVQHERVLSFFERFKRFFDVSL